MEDPAAALARVRAANEQLGQSLARIEEALAGRAAFTSDDLRTIAVSRLFLDNVPHIKAYWVSLTPDVGVRPASRQGHARRAGSGTTSWSD